MSRRTRATAARRAVLCALLAAFAPRLAAAEERPEEEVAPVGARVSLTSAAQFQRDPGQRTLLLLSGASYDLGAGYAALLRLGFVRDAPAGGLAGHGVSNPSVGARFQTALTDAAALGLELGAILPVGMGGGDAAEPSVHRAMLVATDWGGPMFAPNHLTVSPGAALHYDLGRVFLRGQTTIHQAFRVRGAAVDPIGPHLTFATSGLAVGGRPAAGLQLVAQLAQTLYITQPEFRPSDRASRHDHYLAAKMSWTQRVGPTVVAPALSYVRAIDRPKRARGFQILQLDLAVQF